MSGTGLFRVRQASSAGLFRSAVVGRWCRLHCLAKNLSRWSIYRHFPKISVQSERRLGRKADEQEANELHLLPAFLKQVRAFEELCLMAEYPGRAAVLQTNSNPSFRRHSMKATCRAEDTAQWYSTCPALQGLGFNPQHQEKKKKKSKQAGITHKCRGFSFPPEILV